MSQHLAGGRSSSTPLDCVACRASIKRRAQPVPQPEEAAPLEGAGAWTRAGFTALSCVWPAPDGGGAHRAPRSPRRRRTRRPACLNAHAAFEIASESRDRQQSAAAAAKLEKPIIKVEAESATAYFRTRPLPLCLPLRLICLSSAAAAAATTTNVAASTSVSGAQLQSSTLEC